MLIVSKARRVGLILPALDRQAIRNERIFLISLRKWMSFVATQIRQDLTRKFIKADITADLTDWEFIQENGEEILKPATLNIMQSGGKQAYRIFQVQAAFDVLNPDAVNAAGKFTAKLVRDVTAKTREGIRHYIKEGIKAGKSMPKLAREIRPLVGLTKNQVGSVLNYENWLKENRTDLSAAQRKKKVTTYTNKTHRRRANTIARTETARAQNIGYATGLKDLGVEKVEFQIHPDERTCVECEELNEQTFPVEEGQELIPVHPNCRCVLLPVVGGTPTCRLGGGIRKAECVPPNDLHDEQIKNLLSRLKEATPVEGRKLRSALRKLGHKGGLSGKPPIVDKVPKPKTTKPIVPEPKPKPGKVPDTAPKLEYKELTEKSLSDEKKYDIFDKFGETPNRREQEILLALTGEGTAHTFLTATGKLGSAISLQQTAGKLTIRHLGSVYPKGGLRAMLKATEDAIKSKSKLYFESTKESVGFYRKLGYTEHRRDEPGIFTTSLKKLLKIRDKIVIKLNKGIK